MPLTDAENRAITEANEAKHKKQMAGLLKSIDAAGSAGKPAAKVAMQYRRHLRTAERDGLISYGLGAWWLTDLGRDRLAYWTAK